MRHSDRRRISRRDFFKAAGLTVATLAALGGGAYALQRWDDSQNAVSVADTGPGNDHREAAQLKELTYKGKNYRQRPELETYLFMGIDTMGAAVGVNSYAGGGQADVQIVAVLDHEARTWQALQLNRDSIVRVPVLGVGGDIVAYEDEQLALAHYYGNGREQSCENTVLAVSMLLGDQPIDGYMAVNMDAVGILTDLVGGVTLTVTSDFSAIDPSLMQGETITLTGEQALIYVRSRANIDDETNLARMNRQRQYMTALEEKLMQKDANFVVEAYDALADYMVTDIASGTAAEIGERMQDYTQLEVLTIDGENVVEGEHWAYYLDEDSLQETILQLFYNEI